MKKEIMVDGISRRNRMDKWHPVEKMIHDVMQEVEKMGAGVELTDAIVFLDKARDCVSNFIDEKDIELP